MAKRDGGKRKSLKLRRKIRQKSRKGVGALFISRNQALRKLQLSLKEFRKLCILKGVYPQEPTKKFKKQNKTFYFTKDIRFLLHDPLIPIFRSFKVWRRKLAKAKAKKNYDKIEVLRSTRPRYRLDHLIRERYPTFIDALKDLDDCLSLVSLFASLPQSKMLKAKRIASCAQLCREFQYFMILTRSLKKGFISLKGYYYQGVVFGQTVTWLVPHNFTPKIPNDVDISIMLTFLELYETLLGFVNFRLFQSIGLRYPPVIDYAKLKDNEFYASLRFEPENADEIDEAEKATREEMKEVFTDYSNAIDTPRKNPEEFKKLFVGLRFFISREVPREALEFAIRCFGGAVSYEGPQGTYPESDPSITHQITDRPLANKSAARDYVQPQWVFDSINNQILMPTYEYAVNAKLPPHLSPFVNDEAAGYIPERRQKINEMINLAKGIIPKKKKATKEEKPELEDDSEDELEAARLLETRYANEYDREKSGESYSSNAPAEDKKAVESFVKERLKKKKRTERQMHRFREIMIPTHRKRNAYITSIFSNKRKLARVYEIRAKRAKIDNEKNDVDMTD